jgi:protein-S-isoprenylcysteine O-methyltransferase Ste14
MGKWAAPSLFATLALLAAVHAVAPLGHAVSHPGTRTWLIALYFLLRVGVATAFAAFTVSRSAPHRHAREPVALVACAAAMLLVLPFGGPGAGTSTTRVLLGDAVAVVACAWVMISVLALGRCFGVLPEARGLVIRGPYRFVRHPVYLGEIATLVGLTLCSSTTWSIVVLGMFLAAQSVRMRLEERALTAAFPDYRDYAARTRRLVPRVRGYRSLAPAHA